MGRSRVERTENISLMVVTLDVSRLSGWSNADASYRVEGGANETGMVRVR